MSGKASRCNTGFDGFQKRSGLVVPFSWQKIELAIDRAVDAVARKHHTPKNEGLASKITDQVLSQLDNPQCEFYVYPDEQGKRIPKIEDVQDLVEILLSENGETLTVATYKRYRKQREIARRRIRVRGVNEGRENDTGDNVLLVESTSKNVYFQWDRKRIVKQILDKTDLSVELAINIAKSVENRIIASELSVINTTLVRELVNNELAERGYAQQLRDLSLYRISKDHLESLLASPDADAPTNPDAVNTGIASAVLKQWVRDTVFSPEVKRAHDTGAIHLHHLGQPLHLYSSTFPIEYLKKYGLVDVTNLNTASAPAQTATALVSQLYAYLPAVQASLNGHIDLEHLNVFLAPLLAGEDERCFTHVAQDLVFNGMRNSIAASNHPLRLAFHLSTGIPSRLRQIPAIGSGGRYRLRLKDGATVPLETELGNELDAGGRPLMKLYYKDPVNGTRLVLRELADDARGIMHDAEVEADLQNRGERIDTYGDYEQEAQAFCRALVAAFAEANTTGNPCGQPLCKLHVTEKTVEQPAQFTLFRKACEQACYTGAMHFIFDRNEAAGTPCPADASSLRAFRHPENKRSFSVQAIALNIPQAAYRAARIGGDILKRFFEEIDHSLDLAVDAHLQKKDKLAGLMSAPHQALWQLGRIAADGSAMMDLDEGQYGISPVGLNDAVHFLIGQELHESNQAQQMGLKIIAHLNIRAKKLSKKHRLSFSITEPPSSSAARRMAKSDSLNFPEECKDILKGKGAEVYYTNSIRMADSAACALAEGIAIESKFHSMVKAGTAIYDPGSHTSMDAAAFAQMVTEIFHRTQCNQLSIPPAPGRDPSFIKAASSQLKATE